MGQIRALLGYLAAVVCLVPFAQPALALNPVQIENAKPGTPNWQFENEALKGEIEGYASATSVNRGERIDLFISTIDPAYTITVYRMGWYGGAGARQVFGPITLTGAKQPMPVPDATGMVECNWARSYTLTIPNTPDPTDWLSGFYMVKLNALQSNKQKYIVFVVRDDSRVSNHYFQASVTTWQAYNRWGGRSLYPDKVNNVPPAQRVSFNRPYDGSAGTGQFLWRWEYNMVRFLEREGYDVSYCTNIDTARRGHLIRSHHSTFLSVGHDEYWSWEMRESVIAARDAGKSLAFFSANTAYWQIRLDSGYDGTPDRTIIAYKEQAPTKDPYAIDDDLTNNHLVTTQFRRAPVNLPESAFIGVQYLADPIDAAIIVTNTSHELFAYTGLQDGDHLPGLLGYEVDGVTPHSPGNVVILASTPFVTDDGDSGTSHMTIYTHSSGARVFATGSIQWSWGLDSYNSGARGDRLNPAAQQITRNVLRELAGNAAPRDCQFTLVPASASVPSAAGEVTVTVQTTPACDWSATSNTAWISIAGSASSTGTGTLTIAYASNAGNARTGSVTIADKKFTVSQATGCTATVAPETDAFGADGGTGTFTMTMTGSCNWAAVSSASWLTVTSAKNGIGSTTLAYSAAANEGPARTATITVFGVPFTVTQSSGCTYSISPASATVPQSGGNVTINVSTAPGCSWTSQTHNSWLSMASSSRGSGNGSITYVASANNTSAQRTGSVTVAGKLHQVTQPAPVKPAGDTLYDFDGDGDADIWWRNTSTGQNWMYRMSGPQISSSTPVNLERDPNWKIAGIGDLNGDGRSDVVWRNSVTGVNWAYLMNGSTITTSAPILAEKDLNAIIAAVADFDGNGKADILWRNLSTGYNSIWLMNGTAVVSAVTINREADPNWQIVTAKDFDGNGKADILWRNVATGQNWMYLMNGAAIVSSSSLVTVADQNWIIAGVSDFNGDGKADILWRNTATGYNVLYLMNGAAIAATPTVNREADLNWEIVQTADFDGDGRSDILWRNKSTGLNWMYLMNGAAIVRSSRVNVEPNLQWKVTAFR